MTEKHVLHSCASITMAHAPIVNMQQQMGHSGLLGCYEHEMQQMGCLTWDAQIPSTYVPG